MTCIPFDLILSLIQCSWRNSPEERLHAAVMGRVFRNFKRCSGQRKKCILSSLIEVDSYVLFCYWMQTCYKIRTLKLLFWTSKCACINTKLEMSEVRLKLCFVLFYELYWSESLSINSYSNEKNNTKKRPKGKGQTGPPMQGTSRLNQ